MRTLHYFLLFAALTFVCVGNLYALETSDLFKETLPKMSSENQDERNNAQQEWMRHCLQNSDDAAIRKEACRLMIEQMETDLPVETGVWLIRQLGWIGDDEAVPALKKALADDETRIAEEAARALVNIAGPDAEAALKSVDSPLAKSALHEMDLKKTAPQKQEMEPRMPMAIPYISDEQVAAWMKDYDSLDDLTKAQTLASLAVRRDGKYIKQALDGLESDHAVLRDSAIIAVGALGSRHEIPALLDQLFGGGNGGLAKLTLIRMNESTLDSQLLKQLESEKNFDRFGQIADILKNRDNTAALPLILKRAAASSDSQDRLRLMQVAESLATKENAGDFVEIWEKITDRGQRDQAEQIIARLVDGDSTLVTAKRTNTNYAGMFSLLGRIGDDKSLEEIRNIVFGKTLPPASPALTAAALRAMCNWPNARVAADLIQVVETPKFSTQERIAALRGYIRVASLPNDRIGIDVQEQGKLEMLDKAMQLSVRNEEKCLVIQRVGQVRHADSLQFVMQHFDEPELQSEVCNAIVELAHHTELRNSAKEEFKSALDKVLKTSDDQSLLDRAKRYRDAM